MTVRVSVGFEPGIRSTVRGRVPGGVRAIERLVRAAVRATFTAEDVRAGSVSMTLVSDGRIADLNREYLARTGPTDVIAFPLYEHGETPIGDVYIDLDQAVRQAAALDVSATEELSRLAVHGALHVLGHVHPEGVGRTRCNMWRIQERIVDSIMGEKRTV